VKDVLSVPPAAGQNVKGNKMSIATTQIIPIIKKSPEKLGLSYQELDEKCIKIMEGKGHVALGIDYWDFIEKNRWSVATPLGDKSKVISGSFNATHGFIYFSYLCKKCEGIFSVPFEPKECMFCGSAELEKERKRIRVGDTHGRSGVQDGVNPELYAMAVKDIQEHGTAPSGPDFEPDWGYLEDNI